MLDRRFPREKERRTVTGTPGPATQQPKVASGSRDQRQRGAPEGDRKEERQRTLWGGLVCLAIGVALLLWWWLAFIRNTDEPKATLWEAAAVLEFMLLWIGTFFTLFGIGTLLFGLPPLRSMRSVIAVVLLLLLSVGVAFDWTNKPTAETFAQHALVAGLVVTVAAFGFAVFQIDRSNETQQRMWNAQETDHRELLDVQYHHLQTATTAAAKQRDLNQILATISFAEVALGQIRDAIERIWKGDPITEFGNPVVKDDLARWVAHRESAAGDALGDVDQTEREHIAAVTLTLAYCEPRGTLAGVLATASDTLAQVRSTRVNREVAYERSLRATVGRIISQATTSLADALSQMSEQVNVTLPALAEDLDEEGWEVLAVVAMAAAAEDLVQRPYPPDPVERESISRDSQTADLLLALGTDVNRRLTALHAIAKAGVDTLQTQAEIAQRKFDRLQRETALTLI